VKWVRCMSLLWSYFAVLLYILLRVMMFILYLNILFRSCSCSLYVQMSFHGIAAYTFCSWRCDFWRCLSLLCGSSHGVNSVEYMHVLYECVLPSVVYIPLSNCNVVQRVVSNYCKTLSVCVPFVLWFLPHKQKTWNRRTWIPMVLVTTVLSIDDENVKIVEIKDKR